MRETQLKPRWFPPCSYVFPQLGRRHGSWTRCGQFFSYFSSSFFLNGNFFCFFNHGGTSDPSLNGHLRHPNDIDRSLNEAADDKIRKYRADYNNVCETRKSLSL
jgi:hypothetical protein